MQRTIETGYFGIAGPDLQKLPNNVTVSRSLTVVYAHMASYEKPGASMF